MKFMVEGSANQAPTDEMLAQLPAESARGRELDVQGLRSAIYVAADMSRAWQVFTANSQAEVQSARESLPLYSVTNYTITPLADDQS